jgi:transposase-like protein
VLSRNGHESLLRICPAWITLSDVALRIETEPVGEMLTIVAHEDGLGSELAGTMWIVRCTVHEEDQPHVRAQFDFQCWLAEDLSDMTAYLVAVKLESICLEHMATPVPITISAVRDFPLARWESAARSLVIGKFADDDVEKTLALPIDSDTKRKIVTEVLLQGLYPGIDDDPTPGGRRRARSLRKLADVAAHYRELLSMGRADPAAEIARTNDVSPSTARTWIHRARQAGLLGPAVGRTPGERPTGAALTKMATGPAAKKWAAAIESKSRTVTHADQVEDGDK